MTQPSFTISSETTIYRWLLTTVIGSLFNAIAMDAYDPFLMAIHFLLSFGISSFISVPALVALITLSNRLNKQTPSFNQYLLSHNVFHLLIAGVTFGIIAVSGLTLGVVGVPVLVCCYTLAGLLVWNIGFILNRRKLQKTIND